MKYFLIGGATFNEFERVYLRKYCWRFNYTWSNTAWLYIYYGFSYISIKCNFFNLISIIVYSWMRKKKWPEIWKLVSLWTSTLLLRIQWGGHKKKVNKELNWFILRDDNASFYLRNRQQRLVNRFNFSITRWYFL